MAEFLNKSVKTVNEHLVYSQWQPTLLRVRNTEGTRAGSFSHVERYRVFLRELGIEFPETILIPCDESNFQVYLKGIFQGIVKIQFEHKIGPYRVDGFIESLKVIFELDGPYHDGIKQKSKDKIGESYIKSIYPDFDIVRADYNSYTAIANHIIKRLL
jgi:hypothetical protein